MEYLEYLYVFIGYFLAIALPYFLACCIFARKQGVGVAFSASVILGTLFATTAFVFFLLISTEICADYLVSLFSAGAIALFVTFRKM